MPGSYAEQVAVPAGSAVTVPAGMDLATAAAVMLQGMTAHYLCHSTYPVAEGDPVVVHAAAGGVGLLLTQMVVMRGGTVVATTSTTAKAVLAQQAGAAYVAGYDDFPDVVRRVTGGRGAAVVYDGVGQATFEAGLVALRPRGYLVLYGAASGPVPPFDLQRLLPAGSLFVTRPTLAHYLASREELVWRAGDVLRWIGEGRLSARIGGTYPLGRPRRRTRTWPAAGPPASCSCCRAVSRHDRPAARRTHRPARRAAGAPVRRPRHVRPAAPAG